MSSTATVVMTAVNTTNAINSVNAAAEAHQARVAACQAFVPTFNPETATVETKQAYAGCIQTLHPAPATGGEIAVGKVLVVAAILGAVFGLIWGWRECRGDVGVAVASSVMGAMLIPALLAFVGGLIYGGWWVLFG